jgi:hypothetical protein
MVSGGDAVSLDRDPMDALAGSVSDDKPVDWADAESHAAGEDAQLELAALHEVARIAQFNRELQRSASPPKSAEVVGHGLPAAEDRRSSLVRLLVRIWRRFG